MAYNLKQHLDMCTLKDLKDLVRKFNLHNKIKLGQKKPELIGDLLKHFEAELSAEGMLKQTSAEFEMPKMDHGEKKEKKPRAKKEKVEKMEIKMEEKMKPVEVVVVKVEKVEEPKLKVKKLVIKKVVEKMVEPVKEIVKEVVKEVMQEPFKSEKQIYDYIDKKMLVWDDVNFDGKLAIETDLKKAVKAYEMNVGEKLYKRNPVKFMDDVIWYINPPKRKNK